MTELIIQNINKYVDEKGIKQTWIADVLGTHKMNISNILSGKKKNVTLDELLSIINVLDLRFEDVNKNDFNPKNLNEYCFDDEIPEYAAFCGNTGNPESEESIRLVGELIEIIDAFKSANENALIK